MCSWRIQYVLPNVNLSIPIEHAEWRHVAILPVEDERIVATRNSNKNLDVFLKKFKSEKGIQLNPALIAYSEYAPKQMRQRQCLVDLRNAFALSVVTKGWAENLCGTQPLNHPVQWSDYFRVSPWHWIPEDMTGYETLDASVRELVDKIEFLPGSPALLSRGPDAFQYDLFFLERLLAAWKERYEDENSSDVHLPLFRALEIAFQAASRFDQNDTSIFDAGSSLSQWISAYECLLHPGGDGKIGLKGVLKRIGNVPLHSETLNESKRWMTSDKKDYSGLQKLYKSAYDSRNAFLHGNPVQENHLRPCNGEFTDKPLHSFLLLLFRMLVMNKLGALGDSRISEDYKEQDGVLKLFEVDLVNALETMYTANS